MALADGAGLPLAITVASANPGEISLVDDPLKHRFLRRPPTRIIGDRGDDSDALDAQLATRGIEFIAPHRSTRRNKTQDGRQMRRYCRRWKIERRFACAVGRFDATSARRRLDRAYAVGRANPAPA